MKSVKKSRKSPTTRPRKSIKKSIRKSVKKVTKKSLKKSPRKSVKKSYQYTSLEDLRALAKKYCLSYDGSKAELSKRIMIIGHVITKKEKESIMAYLKPKDRTKLENKKRVSIRRPPCKK